MYDGVRDISTLFYSHMIKYQVLDKLISTAYQGSEATEVNLFIDLYPIIKSLYKHSNEYIINSKHEFVAGILSMISHYRSFFKSIDVYPRIYFIHSVNCPELNRKLVSGYNKSMELAVTRGVTTELPADLRINNYLDDVTNFIMQFFKFVPNTNYYIPTTFESGVIINRIIHEDPDTNKCPNIIISRDLYLMQLVANDVNTVMLKPVKYKGEDKSVFISSKDPIQFWNMFCGFRKIKPFEFTLPCTSINTINSVCRVPERGLMGYEQISSIAKLISQNKFIEDNLYQGRKNAIDLDFQLVVYNNSAERYMFDEFMAKIYDPERFKKYLTDQKINIDPMYI